jgi:hypothetical protein
MQVCVCMCECVCVCICVFVCVLCVCVWVCVCVGGWVGVHFVCVCGGFVCVFVLQMSSLLCFGEYNVGASGCGYVQVCVCVFVNALHCLPNYV